MNHWAASKTASIVLIERILAEISDCKVFFGENKLLCVAVWFGFYLVEKLVLDAGCCSVCVPLSVMNVSS